MIDPLNPDYADTPASPQRAHFDYAPADPLAPPCVSIVTPFFNTGAVFHETAHSVLSQSLQQFEWIIVNDGSTDVESLAMLESYRRRDPRIRVVDHPANRGLSAARNTGFAAARTDYVMQLDSDDLLEPSAVEKLWWLLHSQPQYSFAKGFSVAFGDWKCLWTGGFHERLAFLGANRADANTMVRKSVHQEVGGYDETNRAGLEDWDFWLRCAVHGRWGATVKEFLAWYRRSANQTERWANWDGGESEHTFAARLRERYAPLWTGGFPEIKPRVAAPSDVVSDEIPCVNRLVKGKSRLLLVAPWLVTGGSERFNLGLVDGLMRRGWEVSVVTTLPADHPWLPQFARHTPDIFVLDRFLHPTDYPRFLAYLLRSRQPDAVLVANSELGYHLLPYLKAHAPATAFVDYCHALEEWKNGGYPRMSVEVGDLLDARVVSSRQLGDWMVSQGADPGRIHVCHTNVDADRWRPDPIARQQVRGELGIAPEETVIFTAARISSEKQPRVLAHVLKRLRDEGRSFVAVIAGDGPELPWLQASVAESGLGDRVRLLGAVDPDRVPALAAAADIFFLPSAREGIALVCFEAMSAGLALVVADVGAQRELITPDSGILVPHSDEDEDIRRYADSLSRLLDDPALRVELGRNARARIVGQFRLDHLWDNLSHALTEAIVHATATHVEIPRALARVVATRAIEYARLSAVADDLWRAGHPAPSPDPELAWVLELQEAKRWLEQQYQNWKAIAEDRERTLHEVAAGKDWLEQQYQNWKRIAEERERVLQEFAAGKEWLEQQYHNWQQIAEEREQALHEFVAGKEWLEQQYDTWRHTAEHRELVIAELLTGKAWLEQQYDAWKRVAEEREATLTSLMKSKADAESQPPRQVSTGRRFFDRIAQVAAVCAAFLDVRGNAHEHSSSVTPDDHD